VKISSKVTGSRPVAKH